VSTDAFPREVLPSERAEARRQGRDNIASGIRSAQLHWWMAIGAILLAEVSLHSRTDPGTRLTERALGGNGGVSRYQEPVHTSLPLIGHGVTPSDLIIITFALVAIAHRIVNGRLAFSRRAANVTLAILFPVAVGVAVGLENDTPNHFTDWRNLLIGGLFAAGLWSTVMRSDRASLRFAQLFTAVVTGYAAVALARFAAGGGNVAFYGRTTLGNHAALEFTVAAIALSLAMLRSNHTPALWWAGIVICTLVVALSFRRYAWGEAAIVVLVLIAVSTRATRRRYLTGIAVLAVACGIGVLLTWSSLQWSERLASLDPRTTSQTNALAATNTGHLNDILDGLDQVRAHPLFGLGVGAQWVGSRTLGWKQTTGMVHNGPISVWIKFGLLGLVTYFAIYLYTFKRIWKRRHGLANADLIAVGVGAFLFAQFVISITVYEWPFAVPEQSLLIFGLIAAAFPAGEAEQR
jgi:O-antigen ligase